MTATVARLLGGPCRICGLKAPGWAFAVQCAGAAVPAVALLATGHALHAAIVTLSGWLILAIWVCDEMTRWIPHAFWAAGTTWSIAVQAVAGGPAAAGSRALEAGGMVAALVLAAAGARPLARTAPVGPADFGVVAFLGAALGFDAALDALLIAGILGLGVVAGRSVRSRRQRAASFILAVAAVLGTLAFGAPGAAIAALGLGAWTSAGRKRARTVALPFGALLGAGALILITWTASVGRPHAAAELGATFSTPRSHQP